MKLDKAIEILRIVHDDINVGQADDDLDAIKLGIEALGAVKNARKTGNWDWINELPSETTETNSTRSLHHIKKVLESPLGREPKG